MKYHITITDNESGEIHVDQDTNCIIGACDAGEGTRCMTFSECSNRDKLATVAGALEQVERALQAVPKKLQKAIREMVEKEAREDA